MTATGTAAEGAAASTGLWSTAVGILGSGATWGILAGGVALAAIGIIAHNIAEANETYSNLGNKRKQATRPRIVTVKNLRLMKYIELLSALAKVAQKPLRMYA